MNHTRYQSPSNPNRMPIPMRFDCTENPPTFQKEKRDILLRCMNDFSKFSQPLCASKRRSIRAGISQWVRRLAVIRLASSLHRLNIVAQCYQSVSMRLKMIGTQWERSTLSVSNSSHKHGNITDINKVECDIPFMEEVNHQISQTCC